MSEAKLTNVHKHVPRVIIFFGCDGSGKSTQATLLMKELAQKGLKVKKVWIRGRHSVAFLISQIFQKLGYNGFSDNFEDDDVKLLDSRTLRPKWFWGLIEFLSVIPLVINRVYLPMYLGYYIIAERYVVDTIVYNNYFLGSAFSKYANVLLHMLPRNSLIIHLDASKSDIFARRKINLDLSRFIDFQLASYRKFASQLGALSLNTSTDSVSQTKLRILEKALVTDLLED